MTVALEEPVFVMHGARAAVAGGMSHIEEQVKALELSVVGNTGLAFDLARRCSSTTTTPSSTSGSMIRPRRSKFSRCPRTAQARSCSTWTRRHTEIC